MTKTFFKRYPETHNELIAFNAFDTKGRQFGCQIKTYEGEFVPVTEERPWGCDMPVGHYYVARISATRDGVPFGACQPDRNFVTIAHRDAYIAQRVDGSRKGALKNKDRR